MASHVSRVYGLIRALPHDKVANAFCLPPIIVPVLTAPLITQEYHDLRTIIVIADIHRGLYQPARLRTLQARCYGDASPLYRTSSRRSTFLGKCEVGPPAFDLPALVRRHPLYILLRVRRELCFW